MKKTLAAILFILLFTTVFPVERIEPTLYICIAREVVVHKEPQSTSESSGNLLFGMPAVALARHNDWLGVYLKGGGKGWILLSDMAKEKDFATQYPHLTVNDSYVAQLIKEAVQSVAKRKIDNKLGELKFMKIMGESEEVYVRKDKTVIRSKPSLNARPIRNTFIGEAFVVSGMVRGYYKIEYDEKKFGWLSEEQASPDTTEYMISMENSIGSPKEAVVYVLNDPDEKSPIIGRARRDFTYEVLSGKNLWYEIRLDSMRGGWIKSNDFKIVRQGLKTSTPSSGDAPAANPSNTGDAAKTAATPAPQNASVPVPTQPPATQPVVAPQSMVDVRDTPVVKAEEETPKPTTPFVKIDSLKMLVNQGKVKAKDLEKQIAEAKQDSLAIKGKIEKLKADKLKEMDSLRLMLNNRYKFLKDSLANEKEKYLGFEKSAETLLKLQKAKDSLPGEIIKLHSQAKDIRDRAQNLKELAQFEFDIDTSARAKDSMIKHSKSLDSTAGSHETFLKGIAAQVQALNSTSPEAAALVVSQIDSVEKALPAAQKNEFTALLQKQAALEQMLGQAKTQMVLDAKERIKKLAEELKSTNSSIKRMEGEQVVLERELRKKR